MNLIAKKLNYFFYEIEKKINKIVGSLSEAENKFLNLKKKLNQVLKIINFFLINTNIKKICKKFKIDLTWLL